MKQPVTNDVLPSALVRLATHVQEAVEILSRLVENPTISCEAFAARMKQLRIEGPLLAFRFADDLKLSPVPAAIRENIGDLSTALDEVLDLVDGITTEVMRRRDRAATRLAAEMCRVLLRQVREIVVTLKHFQDNAQVTEGCVEICRLQNVADRLLRSEMARVWETRTDLIEIMTYRKLIDHLEMATGKAESIAELFHSIMLKSA